MFRRQHFGRKIAQPEVHVFTQPPAENGPYHCPCCGCRTLDQRGDYDICPVCFWEDDGQDNRDAEVVRGGPNGALSLTQARRNYILFGACTQSMLKHVRPPLADELPSPGSG